jgi:hypothetical protein
MVLILAVLAACVSNGIAEIVIPVEELHAALQQQRWGMQSSWLNTDDWLAASFGVTASHRIHEVPLQSIHNFGDIESLRHFEQATASLASGLAGGAARLRSIQDFFSRGTNMSKSRSLSSLYYITEDLLTRRAGIAASDWPKSALYRST